MTLRLPRSFGALAALLLAAPAALAGGQATSVNFDVTADTQEVAEVFAKAAEDYRRTKALEWLGREMPRWKERCPLSVKIGRESGGDTEFTFDDGAKVVLRQRMRVWGDYKKMLNSILPHEVTHTVFAQHFGEAVPRWADEGGSVLSENNQERYDHDLRCRQILNQGQGMYLKQLFSLNKYPPDQFTLYAQGYSVTQYLVDKGGRQKFLEFVKLGMRNGNRNWNEAARAYEFDSVDDLQVAWLTELKTTEPLRFADAKREAGPATAPTALTAARKPAEGRVSAFGVPLLGPPEVARGVAPASELPRVASARPEPAPPKPQPPMPPELLLSPPEAPRR